MLKIGCHLSSAQGYLAMGKVAKAIGANTFQFFTRNPRGGKAKPFDEADAAATASRIWDEINYPNLIANILPTRERANLILTKGSQHAIEQVRLRK